MDARTLVRDSGATSRSMHMPQPADAGLPGGLIFLALLQLLCAMLLGSGLRSANAADREVPVIVNAVALNAETLAALQRLYPVPIQPGRYWYDSFSGAYGVEGGPVIGQMSPGLRLGGPLRADTSRGTSRVFINGRQLTEGEKSYIEQACGTPVARGRFWVNGHGLGGFEGGPVSFNLALCGPPPGQNSGGSRTRTFCARTGRAGRPGYWVPS